MAHGKFKDILLKKKFGQHFLRDQTVVDHMINAVAINDASVFEIGPGGGFLTQSILAQPVARLWCFEIDPDWAAYIQETYKDERLTVFLENFLDVDWQRLAAHQPWTVLANLPYQVTFPILHSFVAHRDMLKEGVVMVQEEVAQKIVKTSGRGYGFVSLYFQWFFEWRLMDKIPPGAFNPPPKVHSRLLYFKTKASVPTIEDQEGFWQFIKICFRQPRRTLRNNLMQAHYDMSFFTEDMLAKRAQQLTMDDFLALWQSIKRS